jgi:hypothetical protein
VSSKQKGWIDVHVFAKGKLPDGDLIGATAIPIRKLQQEGDFNQWIKLAELDFSDDDDEFTGVLGQDQVGYPRIKFKFSIKPRVQRSIFSRISARRHKEELDKMRIQQNEQDDYVVCDICQDSDDEDDD